MGSKAASVFCRRPNVHITPNNKLLDDVRVGIVAPAVYQNILELLLSVYHCGKTLGCDLIWVFYALTESQAFPFKSNMSVG